MFPLMALPIVALSLLQYQVAGHAEPTPNRQSATESQATQAPPHLELWSESIGQSLHNGQVRITPKNTATFSHLRNQAGFRAFVLQIEVSFEQEPHNNYKLETESIEGKRELLGFLNFFGSRHATMASDPGHSGKISRQFVFDISTQILSGQPYRILIQSLGASTAPLMLETIRLLRY